MAEYNPKRQKTATDDQDRFREVSIRFNFQNLPPEKESNVEEEEFKEVSVPLKAMKTPSPSTSSDKMKQTSTACETVVNLETEAEVIGVDLEETAFLESGTIEEEYAEIEASLFRSLLNADHSVVNESPQDYENAEADDCMWDEIHANVLPTENDDQNDDDECYDLEEFDDDLTMNSQTGEHLQTFPIPSVPVPESSQSTDDDQPVCGQSQLTIPAMMTLLALFTVKYHLPGEAIAHLLTLLSLALPPDHNLPSTLKSFKAYFRNLNSPVNFHYFCSFFFTPVNSKQVTTCPNSACLRDLRTKGARSYFL